MEEPPKGFFRLAPGREVRLRYAYYVTCTGVTKDPATGEIVELHCSYDPATRGGDAPDGRKVKATLHWVSAEHALATQVRVYDHLFAKENPEDTADGADFTTNLNPSSLRVPGRLQTGAKPCLGRSRLAVAIRAAGLFLRRSGLHARPTGLQPDGGPEGLLGEGAERAVETARKAAPV